MFERHGRKTMAHEQLKGARKVDQQTEADRVMRREKSLDDALEDSFPASDPPAALVPHGSEK